LAEGQNRCFADESPSQADKGWTSLPTRYDEGGFTGGSMDHPALGQPLADICAGNIDVVVV
jgi:hypothetical protein